MIVLVVFTDGRGDLLAQTVEAAEAKLRGPITRRLIIDDSGDEAYGTALRANAALSYGGGWDVLSWGERLGFGGTIAKAWEYLIDHATERFVFHLEDDFLIRETIDLTELAAVLDARPYLAQLSLLRQPWNDVEKAAGGIVQCAPDDYVETSMGATTISGHERVHWLEQRRFFTTNPSLYRRQLCAVGWPGHLEHSEGMFTHALLEDPEVRFGIWGRKWDEPRVWHIGEQRVGHGY